MGKLTSRSQIDPYFNNVELLMHMDGTNGSTIFIDSSLNNVNITANGNAQINTTTKIFGAGAGYFTAGAGANPDGTKSWLTTPSPLLDGTGPFTVEAWVYLDEPDYYQTVYSTRDINIGSSFGFTDNNEIFAYSDSTGGLFSGYTVNYGEWTHVAWVYDGDIFKMFVFGVEVYSESISPLSHGNQSYIGRASIFPESNYGEFFKGYIDEFRITKGIARYTSNFTPLDKQFYDGIIEKNISIKKQNLGGGKLKTFSNLLLNSRFDKDNNYPYAGYDSNYGIGGWAYGGSQILTNYYHNSPLFFGDGYLTLANKTFHEINSPYNILFYGHALQPRLLKMFGAGSKFGALNNTNYLKTITSTTSFTPTDNQSWTKYGVEQTVAIPSWARKVKYGVKYLIISGDEFRFNNFGGLSVYFQKGANRSYVNLNMIRKETSVDTAYLDDLDTFYGINSYVNFNSDAGSNALCQWLGPQTSKVKVKRRPSTYIGASNLDVFNVLSDTIDIPIFSTSGGSPDANDGFPDYVSIQMFFAEWVSYLNNSGILSGAIYFYEPFLYFTEF